MKNVFKKTISLLTLFAIIFTNIPVYGYVVVQDIVEPTVTISEASSSTVVAGGSVSYNVSANDNVGLESFVISKSDITLNGFTASISIESSGNRKVITFSNIMPLGSSAHGYFTLAAGVAKDEAGNKSLQKNSPAFGIQADTTVPTMTISAASPSKVSEGGSVSYTVSVNDNVRVSTFNITKNDITLNGFLATISITGSGNSRTVTFSNISNETSSTDKYFTIAEGVAKDPSGNKSARKNSPAFTIEKSKDTTAPTMTISAAIPSRVSEGGSVTYTVSVNDNVGIASYNIAKSDITLNGFLATVSITGTGNVRTITFSNISNQNNSTEKYFTVAAGVAKDAAGNKSIQKNSPAFIIEKDTTAPTMTISAANPSSIYEGETVSYTVSVNDNVGIASFDISVDAIKLNGFSATTTITGSGNVRTITFSNVKNTTASLTDKYFTIAAGVAKDAAGNKTVQKNSPAFSIKKAVDSLPPTLTISAAKPKTALKGGVVIYTVEAKDDIGIASFDITNNNLKLYGFEATVSITGTGNTRTITFSNVQSTNTTDKYFTVAAGVAKDTSGNTSSQATSPTFKIIEPTEVDITEPRVIISSPVPSSIYAGETVKYTVYFEDDTKLGTVNFNASYVELHGFTANKTVTGSGSTYVVTLSNVQSNPDSDNYITVLAGAAQDAAGNKTKQTDSSKFTVLKKDEPIVEDKDKIAPVVSIGRPSPSAIYSGGTIVYNVSFTDNIKVTAVNLKADKIKTVGFTADVSVKVNGLQSAVITLKNVKGNVGENKYITIDAGVALDKAGNRSAKATSYKFSIVKKATTVVIPPVVEYTGNCIDDLSLLGDINKEITYFASWLRAEKYTATYVQENNYVAEDERMTYMVEYYNGSTAPAPDVKFELTIPYKVIVEEINGGGKITKQTENETVITWNMGTIPSYAASQGRGYCRLYVRVRFLQNEALENSASISEVFYPTLMTTAGGNYSYSYLRQLFIDTTEGKTGTYRSYLTTMDTTNQIRPDDEITRAEFAKLLADSGILNVTVGSNDYKVFKDYEKIPAYARDAVAALAKTDIIQAFPDGTFRPNNPILMEDVMQMIAQAATYMSEQKLTVYKPVFLYTEALTGKDKEVSPKKDYIMELMRQNVVVKYKSNPDSYALRKEVVSMVNSLTFRGPYVENLPQNTLKFSDIRDDSVFFYNIVGASNSYKYTYDYRLWQQIVEIQK